MTDDGEEPHELDGVLHFFNTAVERLLADHDRFAPRRTTSMDVSWKHVGFSWELRLIMQLVFNWTGDLTDDYELLWPDEVRDPDGKSPPGILVTDRP